MATESIGNIIEIKDAETMRRLEEGLDKESPFKNVKPFTEEELNKNADRFFKCWSHHSKK
ncbi:MAG: hypothetical protein LBP26_05600 [Clostridiales bacterium]|jgi:hypothetical protein|nr:hypothetical protein [Clostridiales bacterium]